MNDRFAGYHFDVQFGPMWRALNPIVSERARAVGVDVATAGYALEPRALMLRVAGTQWTGLTSGDVLFQVFEFRNELDAFVVQEPSVTSKELLTSFGVQDEKKGWTSTKLAKAAGLWIRDGSLVLHAYEMLEEQELARFDMWRAFDALARLASGEASFGPPIGVAGKNTSYSAQAWAPELATAANVAGAKATAIFQGKTTSVVASVTLMQRG